MQEALHLLEFADGVTHRVVQGLGNAKLEHFAGMTPHQIQRRVPLAAGAMAVRLAALAGTFRQRPAQKPRAGGDLRDPGAEGALGGGKFGAVETRFHDLYLYYTRHGCKARAKTQCEYALEPNSGQNNNGIKCFGGLKNLVAESLAYTRASFTLILDEPNFKPCKGDALAIWKKQPSGEWLIANYAQTFDTVCDGTQ